MIIKPGRQCFHAAASVMKLQCAEFLAAFERHFSFKILQVATNTRNSSDLVASSENHGGVFCFQIARQNRAIVSAAVTDVADGYFEMIAPEEWWSDELLACAENVARRSLPLPFCHDPVLHTNAACARIGPASNIAGSKNSRDVCFQKFVYQYAVVRCNSCCFSKRCVRTYANSNDDEIAIQYRSVIQLHLSILYDCRRSPEVKFYSVLLVGFVNQF